MRGIYVIHDWKPNRHHIHKVGMSESVERRKGEYATHTFEPVYSRIYEINEGFDLKNIEDAIHDKLERMGVKVGPEWFEVEVEVIDKCAIELFDDLTGLFKGALKELHLTDPTVIEREDYEKSPPNKNTVLDTETSTTDETICTFDLSGFQPRDDQLELLARLKEHFIVEGHERGQIRLPPGYGKTQIGCCLFPVQNGLKRILILVPSIKLAKETASRVQQFHKQNLNIHNFKYFQVHSEGGCVSIEDINKNEYVCVIGVYNSVAKLRNAQGFDIIIFDEAHRTAIKSRAADEESTEEITETHFTFALSNVNVMAKYRLFMTATPRIINNDENSMSNTDRYGDIIYSMTIRQAVRQHIINDYKIWMHVGTHDDETLTIDTVGARFALLLKFFQQCKGDKTLIVCRSIKSCEFVKDQLHARGFDNVLAVHSQMNKNVVDSNIAAFKATKTTSMLCAVNMFKEGIDCPAIDSIVFYDERSSVIDVLQIVGRGLRYKPDLAYTDVGILCSVNMNQRLDEQCEMRYLRMILQNMFDYNEELTNNLQIVKNDDKALEPIDAMIAQVRNEMRDNEDTEQFQQVVTLQSDVGKYGELHFAQAKDFAQERSAFYGWRVKENWFDYISRAELPKDIPRRPDIVYKNMGWTSWDDFLGLNTDKPFDLSTLKYVIRKEINTSNPTTEEYNSLIEKYGNHKIVTPLEFRNVYGVPLYQVLEHVHGKNDFMTLEDMRRRKSKYTVRGRFGALEYAQMRKDCGTALPTFPLEYYDVTSFLKL